MQRPVQLTAEQVRRRFSGISITRPQAVAIKSARRKFYESFSDSSIFLSKNRSHIQPTNLLETVTSPPTHRGHRFEISVASRGAEDRCVTRQGCSAVRTALSALSPRVPGRVARHVPATTAASRSNAPRVSARRPPAGSVHAAKKGSFAAPQASPDRSILTSMALCGGIATLAIPNLLPPVIAKTIEGAFSSPETGRNGVVYG